MRKVFSNLPIRANTCIIACKCINIKSPGPRLSKELEAAKMVTNDETIVPVTCIILVAFAVRSKLYCFTVIQIVG